MNARNAPGGVLRRSQLLVRVSGPELGQEIVGAGFSCAYAVMPENVAHALFNSERIDPDAARRSLPAATWDAFDKALNRARDSGWLLPEGVSETRAISSRAQEDMLEEEVGTPGLWKETRRFYNDFLMSRGLLPEHKVFDVGCGNLRIGSQLVRYLRSGHYVGIDVRQAVLEQARALLDREGISNRSARLFLCDSFSHPEMGGELFDVIIAFQLLYHLEDMQLAQAFDTLIRRLMPEGRLYANVQFAYNTNDAKARGRWKEFPFIRRSREFYREMADRAGLEMEVIGRLDTLGYDYHTIGATNHMLAFARKPEHR